MKSDVTIKYDTLLISDKIRYVTRKYQKIGAKVKGFLKPPYSGMFNILVQADDQAEVWMSTGPRNMSTTSLVSPKLVLCSSIYIGGMYKWQYYSCVYTYSVTK